MTERWLVNLKTQRLATIVLSLTDEATCVPDGFDELALRQP